MAMPLLGSASILAAMSLSPVRCAPPASPLAEAGGSYSPRRPPRSIGGGLPAAGAAATVAVATAMAAGMRFARAGGTGSEKPACVGKGGRGVECCYAEGPTRTNPTLGTPPSSRLLPVFLPQSHVAERRYHRM
eukprot:364198-Chlamydomonas_euryale.AAC.20